MSDRGPRVLEELGAQFSALGPPPRSARLRARGTVPLVVAIVLALAAAGGRGDRDRAGRVAAGRQPAGPGRKRRPAARQRAARRAGWRRTPTAANRPGTCASLEPPPGRRARPSARCSAAASGSWASITCSARSHSAGWTPAAFLTGRSRARRRARVRGRTPSEVRTVVDGVAGSGARSVTVYGPGGARHLRARARRELHHRLPRLRRRSAPAAADRGPLRPQGAARLRPDDGPKVPDPEGRSPWQVSGSPDLEGGAYPDENCAQASEELGRSDPNRSEAPLTPEVCGRLGSEPLFALIRRFVPGSGEHTGFPWGNAPSRTLVYGAASRAGREAHTGGRRAPPDLACRTARRSLPGGPRRAGRSPLAEAGGRHPRRPQPPLRPLHAAVQLPAQPPPARTTGARLPPPAAGERRGPADGVPDRLQRARNGARRRPRGRARMGPAKLARTSRPTGELRQPPVRIRLRAARRARGREARQAASGRARAAASGR